MKFLFSKAMSGKGNKKNPVWLQLCLLLHKLLLAYDIH